MLSLYSHVKNYDFNIIGTLKISQMVLDTKTGNYFNENSEFAVKFFNTVTDNNIGNNGLIEYLSTLMRQTMCIIYVGK